jgi:hypothetical protein
VIRSSERLKIGQTIVTRFSSGSATSTIESIEN